MFRSLALALPLIAALDVPAMADQCYSPAEARAMVQQGQAQPLSSVLRQIRAIGQIVSTDAMLCDVGGRLVYLIDVIQNGNVIHVQVDATSGQITY
ncbi:MAG TPA: PepSY domain-containing protein [Bauldia sp.]|nr:PepSY domain-containing protein [Bauldia sp.]